MIFKLLFLLLATNAFAFDKDFTTANDRIPFEFKVMFDSMKIQIKNQADKIKLVGACKELDENLGTLEKEHIFFLMKSEVIKNLLEYKHKKVRSFDVTTFLLQRLNESYEQKKPLLTPFSQWIWRSIIAELELRKASGLITTNSFNAANFKGTKEPEARRFQKYLTYLLPWIDKMDSLEATDFNKLTQEVSWVILSRLSRRSLLFKRFATTATTDTKVTLFNIPQKLLEVHPEDIKRAQSDAVPLTLKEESEKQKTEAVKDVQSATPEDLSPLSEDISKELDKKAP